MYNHNFNSWYMEDSFKEFGLFLDQISYWLTCLYDRLWNVHTICCHYHFLTLTIQDMHSIKHIWLILQWPVLPWASYQTRTIGIAHAPGIPGTFSPPRLHRKPLVSDPGMHHGTCVSHVPWCMSGLLTRYGGKKTFPAFPTHAQHAIVCIWQEGHGGRNRGSRNCSFYGRYISWLS